MSLACNINDHSEQTGTTALKCRYCDISLDDREAVMTLAYLGKTPDVCHSSCKANGERQEAMDCQIIDSDCNDCKHYQRGKIAHPIISRIKTIDGRMEDVVFKPQYFIGGKCLKFDKEVIAQPNKWTGHDCFEHRRAA